MFPFWISIVLVINGRKIPYVFVDFDVIYRTGNWTNTKAMNDEYVLYDHDDNVTLITQFYSSPLTNVSDNSGVPKGVFPCDNRECGAYHCTPKIAVEDLPQLAFSAFTLEVVVKPTKNDVTSFGYIIGIEATDDMIDGDSISYNRVHNDTSDHLPNNKFFASNIESHYGWKATDSYWDSVVDTKETNITKFYHVIVTQTESGMVTVFVNGVQYGTSYAAMGGMRPNNITHYNWYLSICGDGWYNTGFDGYIRAFAFYTESLTSDDALSACYAAQNSTNMVDCDTPYPTSSSLPPTMDTTNEITENTVDDDWIDKEGDNCGDGYTDLDGSHVHHGEYCQKCPKGTAGTSGVCKECDVLQEPNHERTDCEIDYSQPWWTWVAAAGAIICVVTCLCCILIVLCRMLKKNKRKEVTNDKEELSQLTRVIQNDAMSYAQTHILVKNALIISIAIAEYMSKDKDDLYDVCRDVAHYRDVLSTNYKYKFMSSVDMKGNQGYTMTKQDVERFVKDECLPELLGGDLIDPTVKYDALLVAFSGHGILGSIVCSDSQMIAYSTIRKWFQTHAVLLQIPRLYCIDACRVEEMDDMKQSEDDVVSPARGGNSEAPSATIMGQREGHIVTGGKVSKYLCKQWDEEFEAKKLNPKAIYKPFGALYEAAFDEVMNDTKHSKTPQRLIAAEYDRRIDNIVFIPEDGGRGIEDGAQIDGTAPVIDDDLRNILRPQSDSQMDLLQHLFVLFNANYRNNALLSRLNRDRLSELGINKVFEQKELIRRVSALKKQMAQQHPAKQTAVLHQKYRNELAQLNAMGFTDVNANIEALVAKGGNVQAVVDLLLTAN
eukprot:1079145_1